MAMMRIGEFLRNALDYATGVEPSERFHTVNISIPRCIVSGEPVELSLTEEGADIIFDHLRHNDQGTVVHEFGIRGQLTGKVFESVEHKGPFTEAAFD